MPISPVDLRCTETLTELLAIRAEQEGADIIYSWLMDNEEDAPVNMSYAELDGSSRRVAAALQARGLKDERVALLHKPGLEFATAFFGCLYAGAVAVPAYAPKSKRDLPRIAGIVRDCSPMLALTDTDCVASVSEILSETGLPIASAAELESEAAAACRLESGSQDDLAYLQYTSGSTSDPRGVMISHRNVMDNIRYIAAAGGFAEESVTASWLPHFHDMGLIYGLLLPLYVKAHAYLFAPASFIARPTRWLQTISQYRATHSGAPNFAYDLCVERVSAGHAAKLDLRCWRVAFNGGEPVDSRTLQRFSARSNSTDSAGLHFIRCTGWRKQR